MEDWTWKVYFRCLRAADKKRKGRKKMQYLLAVFGIFGLDNMIKSRVEKKTGESAQDKLVLKNTLIIRKYHNNGAFLNLGEKKKGLVAFSSVVITLVLTVLLILSLGNCGNVPLRTGLTFLLGGAFSNTYDRLKRKYVVDYVSFNVPCKRLKAVVYNISDFFIMAGAMLSVIGFAKT